MVSLIVEIIQTGFGALRTLMLDMLFVNLLVTFCIEILFWLHWILAKRIRAKILIFVYSILWCRALFIIPIRFSFSHNRLVDIVVNFALFPENAANRLSDHISRITSGVLPSIILNIIVLIIAILWIRGAVRTFKSFLNDYKEECNLYEQNAKELVNPAWKKAVISAKNIVRLKKDIPVAVCPDIFTPIVIGIRSPHIYIPEQYENGEILISPREMVLYTAHEYSHCSGHDPFKSFLVQIVCAVYWWNRFFRNHLGALWDDRIEVACDDRMLKYQSKETTHDYFASLYYLSEKINIYNKSHASCLIAYCTSDKFLAKSFCYRLREFEFKYKNVRKRWLEISFTIIVTFLLMLSCLNLKSLLSFIQSFTTANSIIEVEMIPPVKQFDDIIIPAPFDRKSDLTINRLVFSCSTGTKVYSPISGEVVNISRNNANLGMSLTIKYDYVFVTIGHLLPAPYSVGDSISQNDYLGEVNLSGKVYSTGCEIVVTDLENNPIDLFSILERYHSQSFQT